MRGLRERYEIYPRRQDHRRRLSTQPSISPALHHRPVPARQSDRPDRRGGELHPNAARQPAAADRYQREGARRLIIKQEALKGRRFPASDAESKELKGRSLSLKKSLPCSRQRWNEEKKRSMQRLKEKKNQLEKLRFQEEEAERASDYNRVAEIRYSEIPSVKKEIEEAAEDVWATKRIGSSRKKSTSSSSPRSSPNGLEFLCSEMLEGETRPTSSFGRGPWKEGHRPALCCRSRQPSDPPFASRA